MESTLTRRTLITGTIGAGSALLLAGCTSPDGASTATATASGGTGDPALASGARTLVSSPNAEVVLVEFFDFQCPPCKQFAPILEQVAANTSRPITIAVRNFPLPMHPNAPLAARAAEAAAQQDVFTEVYHALFEQQDSWTKLGADDASARITTIISATGIDMDKWAVDLSSAQTQRVIDDDLKLGSAFAVRGTPTLFVNGVDTTPQSAASLEALIAKL